MMEFGFFKCISSCWKTVCTPARDFGFLRDKRSACFFATPIANDANFFPNRPDGLIEGSDFINFGSCTQRSH